MVANKKLNEQLLVTEFQVKKNPKIAAHSWSLVQVHHRAYFRQWSDAKFPSKKSSFQLSMLKFLFKFFQMLGFIFISNCQRTQYWKKTSETCRYRERIEKAKRKTVPIRQQKLHHIHSRNCKKIAISNRAAIINRLVVNY